MRYTFCKQERLCSEKLLEELFHSGHRLMVFPYSVRWKLCPAETLPDNVPVQVLIATSKKKFHHAVDRVRVKRLTRECYRLHKPQLYQFLADNNLHLLLAVNYVHNEIFDYQVLFHKFDKLMAQLTDKISQEMVNKAHQEVTVKIAQQVSATVKIAPQETDNTLHQADPSSPNQLPND